MEREPGDFERREDEVLQSAGEDDIDRLLASLPTDEHVEIAAAIAEAEADIAAGRCVPHEQVAEWLKTWGTADFKPMPDEWLK